MSQAATAKASKKETTVTSEKVTTAFTTLPRGAVWKHTGKLYVRGVHDDDRYGDLKGHDKEIRAQIAEEKDEGKKQDLVKLLEMPKLYAAIPYLEENRKPEWLLKLPQYGGENGEKPILLTYKASENTLEQSPLYGGVLAKETLHHRDTSPEMKRIFNNHLDRQLRKDWKARSKFCPLFIQLWEAYPHVYDDLKQRDGQLVTLSYAKKKLTITLEDKEYILDVRIIKN